MRRRRVDHRRAAARDEELPGVDALAGKLKDAVVKEPLDAFHMAHEAGLVEEVLAAEAVETVPLRGVGEIFDGAVVLEKAPLPVGREDHCALRHALSVDGVKLFLELGPGRRGLIEAGRFEVVLVVEQYRSRRVERHRHHGAVLGEVGRDRRDEVRPINLVPVLLHKLGGGQNGV
jgi:hypothetical protein